MRAGDTDQRYKLLKETAHLFYRLPGAKPAVCRSVRFVKQRLPYPSKTQQRLYNFFCQDPELFETLRCRIPSPTKPGSVELELFMGDWVSRIWFYEGYERYEAATVDLISRLAPSKKCFFDIGANVGYYTLLAAGLMEGRGEVHAFEPQPGIVSWLRRNVELNRFTNTRVHSVALSDQDGRARFFLPENAASAGMASLIEAEGAVARPRSIEIETVRLDRFCRENKIPRIDLMKIDVEGAEIKVFAGMGELLDAWKPDIICEVQGSADRELNAFFARLPYKKFIIAPSGLQPVDAIRSHADSELRNYYLTVSG